MTFLHTTTLLLLICLLCPQCKKEKPAATTPVCVENLIIELQHAPKRNPPAKIYEYQYNGNTVYYVPAYCCDFFSNLMNSDCAITCHPDGGNTGTGDGTCSEFIDNRSNEKLIWEDLRD